MFIALAFLIFLTSSIVFFAVSKVHNYFSFLATIALVQSIDFMLYLLPDGNRLFAAIQALMFGSFYCYGPLLVGFIRGLLDAPNLARLNIRCHLIMSIILSLIASLFFIVSLAFEATPIDTVMLDVLTIVVPFTMFLGYQLCILAVAGKNNWPNHVTLIVFKTLTLLTAITLVSHLALLFGWLPEILRIIIPSMFALALYAFFVFVTINFTELRKTFSIRKGYLNVSQRKGIQSEVIQYLRDGLAFQNSDLRLNDVANAIGINEKWISESINVESGTSFQNLVNRYRLDYVIEKLSSNDNPSRVNLLELALDAGFGSKTSFNRAFKSAYGVSPRNWINQSK